MESIINGRCCEECGESCTGLIFKSAKHSPRLQLYISPALCPIQAQTRDGHSGVGADVHPAQQVPPRHNRGSSSR